jgi:hypothetical protein
MRISAILVSARFTVIRCIALLMLLCASFAAPASAQAPPAFTDLPGLPVDEPQSARITALIEAVNSGDRDFVMAFVKDNFTLRF